MSSRSQPQLSVPRSPRPRESIDFPPDAVTPPLGGMRRTTHCRPQPRISRLGDYPFWGCRYKVASPILRLCGGVRCSCGGLTCKETFQLGRRVRDGPRDGARDHARADDRADDGDHVHRFRGTRVDARQRGAEGLRACGGRRQQRARRPECELPRPDALAYPGPRCLLNPQTPPANFPGTEPALPACAASTPFTTAPDSSRPSETVTWWGRIRRVSGMGARMDHQFHRERSQPDGAGLGAGDANRPGKGSGDHRPRPGRSARSAQLALLGHERDALQSVEIRSPFYSRGNLSIGNGVEVYAPLYVTCVAPPARAAHAGYVRTHRRQRVDGQHRRISISRQRCNRRLSEMETDGPTETGPAHRDRRLPVSTSSTGARWRNEATVAPCQLNRTDKVRVYSSSGDQVMPPTQSRTHP